MEMEPAVSQGHAANGSLPNPQPPPTPDAPRVALVAIARPTFDVPLAQSVAERAAATLAAAGMTMLGETALVMDAEGAARAGALLESEPFDLLVLLQASFADSSMALELARRAATRRLPVLLWAVPDERSGGRLRLNSLCGINLAGHAFTLNGIRFDYLLTQPDDPAAAERLLRLARSGRALRRLQGARVGLVGDHPAGFDTCRYDPDDLAALFGVGVERIALPDLLREAAAAPDAARAPFLQAVAALAPNLDEMDPAPVRGTAGVYAALKARVQGQALAGVAVRCWPEFFTELGCAACGAMSQLGNEGAPASCEADVNGTVTSLLLQALTDTPAFIADLVSIEPGGPGDAGTGVLWHCGLAPAALADVEGDGGIRATIHSNRKLPLLFEFALKPGRVTLARLHRRALEGGTAGYALVVGGGEMVRAPRSFGGTSGVIRFDRPATQVLDVVMRAGLEHHLCLVYGDVREELRALAAQVGLPVLELT
jgi:L-fucose isomerase-like protein